MATATRPKARIARLFGTFLTPGASRNGRLYTRENIATAVESLNARIAAGETIPVHERPLMFGTHKASLNLNDDTNAANSADIAGRITRAWQDSITGAAKFEADAPDSTAGRDYASLADHRYAPNISVRFHWGSPTHSVMHEGQRLETADSIDMRGFDFTPKPGMDEAVIDSVKWEAAPTTDDGSLVETFDAALSVEADTSTPCPTCGTDPSIKPAQGPDTPIESAPADPQEITVTEAAATPAVEAAPAVVQMTAEQFSTLVTEAVTAYVKATTPEVKTEAAPAVEAAGSSEDGKSVDMKELVRSQLMEMLTEAGIEPKRKGLVTEAAEAVEAPQSRAQAIAAVAETRTAQIEARRSLGLPV